MTKATYPNHAYNITYTYDTTGAICDQTTQIYNKGHLTHIVDFSGQTVFCYDRFGRVAAKAEILDDLDFATQYTYSLGNRLLQEVLPHTGTIIAYTRDTLGRITQVTYRLSGQNTDTTLVSNVTYYPFGPIASITYANGRTLNRTYDQGYVVSAISDSGTGGLNLSFGRDVLGNLTQVSSGSTGNVLGYDGLNRLTSVTDLSSNPIWAYSYDATGNRLSKQQGTATAVPYAYPTTSHQLQAVGSYGRSYDAAGNTASIASATGALNFSYDPTGRMSQVANASNTVLMQYGENALGQRVEKYLTGNNADTALIEHDEAGHVIGDYNYTGNRIDETIWMDGMPIALLSGTSGTLSYIEPDQLGTPRVAIDGTSNAATWTWSPINDPFGETQPTGALALNLRMPGQSYDAESGLNYNYFRDYDSSTDREIESDPLGLRGGISTYAYVGGNPLSYRDPFGLAMAPAVPIPTPGVITLPEWVGPWLGDLLGVLGRAGGVLGGIFVPSTMDAAACEMPGSGPCGMMSKAKPNREQKPPNCPTGTKPIDQLGLSKDDVHTIKSGINAGPKDWVGIDPEGNVWINEDGEASDQGPKDDYLPNK